MPKIAQYPDEVEDLNKINISDLKSKGFLSPGLHSGVVTWSNKIRDTNNTISIITNVDDDNGYIELSYLYKCSKINYKIYLEQIPSNLNKGEIWYFVCPKTHKRCRKLYLKDGYFYHRTAFKDLFYRQQIQSKRYRPYDKKIYNDFFNPENLYKELNKKYLKKYYKGIITKRYSKLKQRQLILNSIDLNLESLLMN